MDNNKIINKILKEILLEIKPELKNNEKEFINIIENKLKNENIKAKITIGGSFAKKTHLKKDYDIDVFIRFDYNLYKNKDISKILFSILKEFNPEIIKGSRTYYQIEYNNFLYEIVPVLFITNSSKALNTMDMSPLHVNWMRQQIIINPKLNDQIRLIKAFCKAQKIYGAESYIQGFSGHVLDILSAYYGSFIKLLKAVANWKEITIIDCERHYKNENEILRKINKSKQISPLIIIDPILKTRNAAAALSKNNYNKLIELSQKFLKKPNKSFFVKKKIKEKTNKNTIVLNVLSLNKREDIAGSKLVKAFNIIQQKINKNGFEIIKSEWEWNKKKGKFFFKIKGEIKKEFFIEGPYIKQKENVNKFKLKHKKTFILNNRIIAIERRKFVKIIDLIKEIIVDDKIKKLIKDIKIY